MKYALTAAAALATVVITGCDRPATTTSNTVKERETVVQRDVPTTKESTTIVQPAAPAPSTSTNVTIDATKPATTEESKSTTTSRVDTPMGSATKTETTKTETTK